MPISLKFSHFFSFQLCSIITSFWLLVSTIILCMLIYMIRARTVKGPIKIGEEEVNISDSSALASFSQQANGPTVHIQQLSLKKTPLVSPAVLLSYLFQHVIWGNRTNEVYEMCRRCAADWKHVFYITTVIKKVCYITLKVNMRLFKCSIIVVKWLFKAFLRQSSSAALVVLTLLKSFYGSPY